MTKKLSVVEINGRKYDTRTGQVVNQTPATLRVIDGFSAPVNQSMPAHTAEAKAPVSRSLRQANSSSNLHQRTQKTKKLHPAVANRSVIPKRIIAKTNLAETAPQQITNHEVRSLRENPNRAERARSISMADGLSRFGSTTSAIPKDPAPEPIAPAEPNPIDLQRAAEKRAANNARLNPVQPEIILEESAPQPPSRFKSLITNRPKLVPVTMSVVTLLVIGGYIGYRSIPSMSLRIAAQRAGFNATLPGYQPAGFSFTGPISYATGVVELEYSSNSDQRSYRLIQRESTWDSSSLLDNFVNTKTQDYLTIQDGGITIYIYDQSNATWVDGGIWFTIEGESLLTNEQLLKIARSI